MYYLNTLIVHTGYLNAQDDTIHVLTSYFWLLYSRTLGIFLLQDFTYTTVTERLPYSGLISKGENFDVL